MKAIWNPSRCKYILELTPAEADDLAALLLSGVRSARSTSHIEMAFSGRHFMRELGRAQEDAAPRPSLIRRLAQSFSPRRAKP